VLSKCQYIFLSPDIYLVIKEASNTKLMHLLAEKSGKHYAKKEKVRSHNAYTIYQEIPRPGSAADAKLWYIQ